MIFRMLIVLWSAYLYYKGYELGAIWFLVAHILLNMKEKWL